MQILYDVFLIDPPYGNFWPYGSWHIRPHCHLFGLMFFCLFRPSGFSLTHHLKLFFYFQPFWPSTWQPSYTIVKTLPQSSFMHLVLVLFSLLSSEHGWLTNISENSSMICNLQQDIRQHLICNNSASVVGNVAWTCQLQKI